MDRRTWHWRRSVLVALCGLTLALGITIRAEAEEHHGSTSSSLQITDASYSSEQDRLTVTGQAGRYDAVALFDADSGAYIATVSADRRGNWQLTVSQPEAIPCRVRAVAGNQQAERDVRYANQFPGGCGIGTAPGACDGFVAEPTTCGVGACAATGETTCSAVNGTAVYGDTCTPGSSTPEICTDGIDNDCDGLIDSADPDCAAAAEICTNGVDDDGDGLIDCADPDCARDPACRVQGFESVCDDGVDNDGDGATDCADPDCVTAPACSQVNNGNSPKNSFNILMNYELGMHCTGFEFAYCCVLPPYNSIIAQVVKTEKDGSFPTLLQGDPHVGLDGLGRPTVVRDPALNGNGTFKKYQLRYWHDAQPRNDGRGAPQTSTLISQVEGNSLLMWNTVAEAAYTDANGALVYGNVDGASNVLMGNGTGGANDNYWNAVWNHLYIYQDLEGTIPGGTSAEANKVRLGIDVVYPEDTGAALHPLGPGVVGAGFDNVLTFSGDTGTVVYTQAKVLENLPVMLTSPRLWEALGLPLTPFEDTINFFGDPGAVDEDSVRPYVVMKAQLEEYPSGNAVLDNGRPVIGFGTAPIDIPNCERCHSLADGASVNSAQNGKPAIAQKVENEIAFWNAYYGIDPAAGDSDWYSRLKGAAISILAIHDAEHGTHFTDNWPVDPAPGLIQATRLGHGSVICQRCHADNVIAVVKSANTLAGDLIPPLTEAIHNNHKDNPFSDSLGRNGGCQGCHPAHRSDGDMSGYPITEDGLNAFAGSDNRDAAGGCFVGRDVHSNRNKDNDGVATPSHLNAVGQWLLANVAKDTGTWKGIWCTNCHSQLGQEMWRTDNMTDAINGVGSTARTAPNLAGVAAALGISEAQAIAWLDPKTNDDMAAIWNPAIPDADVATIEIGADGQPVVTTDVDGDISVRILDFCTTADCVVAAQAVLNGEGNGSTAVAVPFSAATDGRDHWLAAGEPHCADCHTAPFVENSGDNNPYPPFNYPRKYALNRYSRGHQDISCQGCHESIHGLYPVTPDIDTTSYAQAASLNADGSHGPLKCASCHQATTTGAPSWMRSGGYFDAIRSDFDTAVTWAHTYTDEADPTQSVCRNCHGNETSEVSATQSGWLIHAMRGRVSRATMDKVEVELLGHVAGGGNTNPLTTVCRGCHGDESSNVSCSNTEWKRHLVEGRVSASVWEHVSQTLTNSTCGW